MCGVNTNSTIDGLKTDYYVSLNGVHPNNTYEKYARNTSRGTILMRTRVVANLQRALPWTSIF